MLIVMVMLGILAAIASASLRNVITRAKESEAKMNVGVLLRGQQNHYMEYGKFANQLGDLGIGMASQTRHYAYDVQLASVINTDMDGNRITEASVVRARPLGELRGYMGKAWLDPHTSGGELTRMVVCEGGTGAVDFMADKTYCP
ncbi:MAG: hypothetical protein F6K09_35845 [Merismopedia sp. SIO2A8]|nr:hypothetical protein [Merismopedia sp. SIO2A8]